MADTLRSLATKVHTGEIDLTQVARLSRAIQQEPGTDNDPYEVYRMAEEGHISITEAFDFIQAIQPRRVY